MVLVLNAQRFCINQSYEYASGTKYAKVLNMSGFWIHQGFEYVRVLNRALILNIPLFNYTLVTMGYEYAWIMVDCTWICLNMPEYTWKWPHLREFWQICLNKFCLTFLICNTFLPEQAVTYFHGFQQLPIFSKKVYLDKTPYLTWLREIWVLLCICRIWSIHPRKLFWGFTYMLLNIEHTIFSDSLMCANVMLMSSYLLVWEV